MLMTCHINQSTSLIRFRECFYTLYTVLVLKGPKGIFGMSETFLLVERLSGHN